MEEQELCFECLQRRINSDFSDRLVFSYGVSDSALPFGSSAVVQLTPDSSSEGSASQFIMLYLPSSGRDCLTKYVNEYVVNETDGIPLPEENGDKGHHCLSSDGTCLSSSLLNVSLSDSNGNDGMAYNFRNCSCYTKVSCARSITALAPVAAVGICSYTMFEDLASDFVSGCLEDHVLCSLNRLIEGKPSGRDGANFLHLVGIPSFDDHRVPGCLRHPNITPIVGLLKTSGYIILVIPKAPYTLDNILHYSPNALKSEQNLRFLTYQLLSALAYLHGFGVAHGRICPSNVMLTDLCWSWLNISDTIKLTSDLRQTNHTCTTDITLPNVGCFMEDCSSNSIYADLKLSAELDWSCQFSKWWRGELSNFEYLLFVNRLAGRRWGDSTFHTVMPWVIDFSTRPVENSDLGWRDLSKSKWRLAKGDEQLDFTYSTSEVPHHVSDECLSELAVCSYKARRLPLSILRLAVRSVYEPNEYPSTMQRLYQWTPDECIPEFYCDPRIFYSLHSGMTDLAVPSWAGSPEEFIRLHRDALESNRVSRMIHHWIDITFGYKMSGEAAIAAKNVMLASSDPAKPKSSGRRQLFTWPHPMRQGVALEIHDSMNESAKSSCKVSGKAHDEMILQQTAFLQELEKASSFSEHARYISPLYYSNNVTEQCCPVKESQIKDNGKDVSSLSDIYNFCELPSNVDLLYLLEHLEVLDDCSTSYQDLLLWRKKASYSSTTTTKEVAEDIFSVGCLLAELYLRRPLFDSSSLSIYLESGVLPCSIQELPPHVKVLVEACVEKDWKRRPSSKSLLESPYFPSTVKSAYSFIAPLQSLAKDESRLLYASNFAKQGALKAMGVVAAEICAPYCLPLIVAPLSAIEAEQAYVLLKEFVKFLRPETVKVLVLPNIQTILQTPGYSHLKVSLLQDSFMRDIWDQIGKQVYLERVHPLVISNLYVSPHKSSAAAASVLLICSSEELGIPITIYQTILPLIHCFGKGLCPDGIDVLVRIGCLLGETFVIKQMLPLLRHVARSCINVSSMNKPEPVQSWSAFALIDCLLTLDGLVAYLPSAAIVTELIEDNHCVHVLALMHANMEINVLQVAATALMSICQRIGPELTACHVLPKLKELFDELAFSHEIFSRPGSGGRSLKVDKSRVGDTQIGSRMDLVLLLYPSLASLLGIEKLRQCCSTWLLLEQFLLRCHNWKWEYTGDTTRNVLENPILRRPLISRGLAADYSPAKLLLNGVGWSIPQSHGSRNAKNLMPVRSLSDINTSVSANQANANNQKHEPWFWFPSPASSWDGPDLVVRFGNPKDESPWKIRATVVASARAHHGALRSLAVLHDENIIFTAGSGPGFKGTVQKWDLAGIDCLSGYYGHEEVVNDICVLSMSGRMASCDGTVHVWNSHTGKLVSLFSESSMDSQHPASLLSSTQKFNMDQGSMLNSNTLSSGVLTSAFDGSLYTCMHYLDTTEMLVVGTGNGSVRFIDIAQGLKLHLWKGEAIESAFPSLVSAMCSCGSNTVEAGGATTRPSWIAAGLSSGHCRIFDIRNGDVIASWRAHDGYITKLAGPEDQLLVSSSLDRTLKIWDLRRYSSPLAVLKGHKDGVSSFSVWGQDVISISRNKIGLSSLSRSADEERHHIITPQKLHMADNGSRNLSVLSSIAILPFSRLFLVGTEEGYLRICC